jgi:hypothetical protein
MWWWVTDCTLILLVFQRCGVGVDLGLLGVGGVTTKKSAYKGGFEKLKTASINYQIALINMNAL